MFIQILFSFAATVTEGERLITSPSSTNKAHSFPTEVKQFSLFFILKDLNKTDSVNAKQLQHLKISREIQSDIPSKILPRNLGSFGITD